MFVDANNENNDSLTVVNGNTLVLISLSLALLSLFDCELLPCYIKSVQWGQVISTYLPTYLPTLPPSGVVCVLW